MKATAKRQKTSVLIPASYPGEVTPDEAVAARSFFVLKITLFASDGAGQKSIAEQRSAYFISPDALQDAVTMARQLGWGVELEVAEMGVMPAKSLEKTGGRWLRFMFRLADPKERGLMGLILGRLLFDEGLATFVEPWPGDDVAVYVRDEAENVKQVLAVTKAAGLTPIGFVKTEGL